MAHILVIDDEPNIRKMIRLTLQQEGHRVEAAADGKEGLVKFVDEGGWDLVLLDQRMPGLEGVDILRQIRYHDPSARIIMITAFGTIDLAVEAMKAGATDFLRKPFTTETLRGAVKAALQENGAASSDRTSATEPEPPGPTFGMTINGFRIEFRPQASLQMGADLAFAFTVRSPQREMKQCIVVLSPVVMELVKAQADRETFAGGNRFWQSLCEEALANYIYQNADFPPEGLLRVEELTPGLRRFVDAVLFPA